MDNPPQSQQGNEGPGYYVSMVDANTQETDEDFILLEPIKEASTHTTDEDFDSLMEPTQEGSFQTIEEDFEFVAEIQSKANNSMVTSDRLEDRRKSIASQGLFNPCEVMNLSDLQLSLSLDSSGDFDVSCGSGDSLVPSGTSLTQSRKRVSTENDLYHKRSKSEICAKSGQDILTDNKQHEVFKLKAVIQIEHDDSHLDPINNELLHEISDSETPQGKFSLDNIPEAPGSSEIHVNENCPNFCRNILQSWYKSEIQSGKFTDEGSLICSTCKKKIHEHFVTEKNLYQCCVCLYSTLKQRNLIMHSFSHLPKKICEICEKKYTGHLHISEHTCKVCNQKFECRTKLEEHSLNHEDYFSTRCWVCSRTIDNHSTNHKGKKLYRCCGCEFHTFLVSNLTLHSKNHRPKVFCKICKKEYAFEENGSHCKEYSCIMCESKFQCQNLLEDHYEDHKEDFVSNCKICNGKIINHQTEVESKVFYKCCRCEYKSNKKSILQNHLSIHTGLRLYPCDVCDKRYNHINSLYKHKEKCRDLLYKCEICGARFYRNSDLEMHHLGKNSST